MFDFMDVAYRETKKGIEIYPKFKLYPTSHDLMIRGGDFYAVWIEELGLWSTNEQDALLWIDRYLSEWKDKHPELLNPRVLYMWDSETGMIDVWHK